MSLKFNLLNGFLTLAIFNFSSLFCPKDQAWCLELTSEVKSLLFVLSLYTVWLTLNTNECTENLNRYSNLLLIPFLLYQVSFVCYKHISPLWRTNAFPIGMCGFCLVGAWGISWETSKSDLNVQELLKDCSEICVTWIRSMNVGRKTGRDVEGKGSTKVSGYVWVLSVATSQILGKMCQCSAAPGV